MRTWCGDFVDLPVYMGSADAIFLNAMFGNVHDQVRWQSHLLCSGSEVLQHLHSSLPAVCCFLNTVQAGNACGIFIDCFLC